MCIVKDEIITSHVGHMLIQIKEMLKDAGIPYEAAYYYVGIFSQNPNGFSIFAREDRNGIIISALGWHEKFWNAKEAFEKILLLLSEKARLKAQYRGNVPYRWTLQYQQRRNWIDQSSVGLSFYPLFEKETVVFLQNHFVASKLKDPVPS